MADIEQYKEDVAKYTSSVNDAALETIAKSLASVMGNRDARNVSCSDEAELATVRKNFIEKKCGLDAKDPKAVAATAAVCEKMAEDRTKNRVTYYYLVAQELGCLGKFG